MPALAAAPAAASLAACPRCGTFLTPGTTRSMQGIDYCTPCAARPEVNFLEALRERFWGKRDTWTWIIGIGGLVNAVLVPLEVIGRAPEAAVASLVAAIAQLAFFSGKRWARYGLMVSLITGAALAAIKLPAAAAGYVMPILVTAVILNDGRNKLFFKMELGEAELKRVWNTHMNNPLARLAMLLGVLGAIVPGAGPAGVVCGAIALRRVDPQAQPPIGRKKLAIASIAIGCLGTAINCLAFYGFLKQK